MRVRVHLLYHQRVLTAPSSRTLLRACERCANEKRKTINGDDILYAMRTLGFEKYSETLEIYLKKYREVSAALRIDRP